MGLTRDESTLDPDRDYLPDELDEADIHDLEFTVAITSANRTKSQSAPLLDALTSYRNSELH
jgi:hypothetical protein